MNNEENFNNNGKKDLKKMFLVAGILIMLFGCISIVIINIVHNKVFNDIKENSTKQSNDTLQEIAIDNENVVNAIESLNYIFVNNDKLYNEFNINNMSVKELVLTAIINLDQNSIPSKCDDNIKSVSFSIDDINNALSKSILNKKITLDDIKGVIDEEGSIRLDTPKVNDYAIKYDNYEVLIDQSNISVYKSCGRGRVSDNIITKLTKALEDDNYLYIYERIAFGKVSDEQDDMYDELIYNYYSDYNTTKKVDTAFYSNSNNLSWNSYDEYKLTFKKVDNKYYFESIKTGE